MDSLGKAGRYDVSIVTWAKENEKGPLKGPMIYDEQVIDIRIWRDGTPMTGVCITDNMVVALLINACLMEFSTSRGEPMLIGNYSGIDFYIYEKIATLKRYNDGSKLVLTRTSFKKKDRYHYDIRRWNADYTQFSYGAAFSEDEWNSLLLILTEYVDKEGLKIPRLPNCKLYDYHDLVNAICITLDEAYLLTDKAVMLQVEDAIYDVIRRYR